VQVPDCSGDKA